ncbi:hypothetical protein BKA67DRAFT_571447 [Truncatella angustata]|uniref:Uncharacterized protein n=1 Tax=Truncatella angustata TaxID=152316 RepID=A0A9P8UGB8_9PEZI|nr:uncharacterized protein BKA67DRAFT_571447 [Truncatella angustata]KAH6651636.1 hypothetical protein BKA67DRAFT_571447 [Truncatella angustata]
MEANRAGAVKRNRDEEDGVDSFRAMTPESSIDEAICSSTLDNKKRRTSANPHLEQIQVIGHADVAMVDPVVPLPPAVPYAEMISRLNVDALRDIVATLAAGSNDARALVEIAYGRRNRQPDLGQYAVEVDEIFKSRGQRYAVSGVAYSDVKSCIEQLAQQVGPYSTYQTKKSALEALLDIAFSILRADRSRQAVEVKAQFEKDDCISQLMEQIARSMSAVERASVSEETTVHGATFARSLQFVHEKAVENYIAGFYDFALVLEVLSQRIER